MTGCFVTFEGGDGSGKSTQLRRAAEHLRRIRVPGVVTREPGGTPFAESARALLLDGGRRSPLSEVYLIEAARADLFGTVIRPALRAGDVVLCDRHCDSTLAYQGFGRGLDLDALRALNRAATGGREPDLTLLYDLDPERSLERRARAPGSSNRLDREPLEFHCRVRNGFLALARGEPRRFVVLDGGLDPARLEELTWAAIEPRLPRRAGRPRPRAPR
jgi:dTMP kinase